MIRSLVTLLIAAVFAVPVFAGGKHFSTTKPLQHKAPDPVRIQMQSQAGGWIHTSEKNPVKWQMQRQQGGWIHTKAKDPVKHQMQQRKGGWVFGSVHGD